MAKKSKQNASETEPVSAGSARLIVRCANTASLATLEASSGAPYASLVNVATLPSGAPVMTMSSLSLHHANVVADNRVSLLFDGTPKKGDSLEGGRVSVSGRAREVEDEDAAERFMARHRNAYYTGFGDFGFYVIDIDRVHFVAGFGRIRRFKSEKFLVGTDLADGEADMLDRLNADHGETIAACASGLLNAPAKPWRICGIDIEGADLESDGVTLRLQFPAPATTPGAVLKILADLARNSRDL